MFISYPYDVLGFTSPSLWLLKDIRELDLEDWELWSLTTTRPFTIMVLLDGQFAAMFPKPRHLKHFVFEILVGDLGVEVEGLETLRLDVVSFEKLEGKVFVEILFLSFQEDL